MPTRCGRISCRIRTIFVRSLVTSLCRCDQIKGDADRILPPHARVFYNDPSQSCDGLMRSHLVRCGPHQPPQIITFLSRFC